MGTSRAGGRASASASITITVTIPATVKKAPDGRSLKSNLGKSASCTMALLEDEPVPANLPHLDGTTCAITRITKAQHEAGAFRGWTVMP